jgi:very-short-patch-repair endonuclease
MELTPEEQKLWEVLRGSKFKGVKFRRQHAIGKFIVDFCSPGKKLIIELDGSQHHDQHEYDQIRTDYLESQGYRLMRFWNTAVMNDMEAVLRAIGDALTD